MAENTKPLEDNEEQPIVEEPQTEEVAAEQPTEEVSATPNKDRFLANLRKKHPDIEDEEGLYDAAMKGYDADHEYAKQSTEEANRLAEIMQDNPDLALMYSEMFERGPEGNPEMALINISDLLKSYILGDITSDEYEAKKAENAKAKADEEAAKAKEEEEKQAKMEAQDAVFREVCEEEGLDYQETLDKIAEVLLKPMAAYEIGKEQVKALIGMAYHDEDVEAARVQGRNEQIVANKRKLARQSDGLANAGSAARPTESPLRESELTRIASRRAAANQL